MTVDLPIARMSASIDVFLGMGAAVGFFLPGLFGSPMPLARTRRRAWSPIAAPSQTVSHASCRGAC